MVKTVYSTCDHYIRRLCLILSQKRITLNPIILTNHFPFRSHVTSTCISISSISTASLVTFLHTFWTSSTIISQLSFLNRLIWSCIAQDIVYIVTIFLILHYNCNDLFSRFEQQILFLEKLAETKDPTTDRHEHDGPSRGSRPKILRKSEIGYWKSTLWTLWRNGRTDRHWCDGPSQVWRTVTDPWWKFGSLNSVTEQQDGPSQARRAVIGCVFPGWVGFL